MTGAFFPSNGYVPKVPFWTAQQCEAFERSFAKKRFALFMAPRTGKSKVIVDTCCFQYQNKYITGLLVVVWPNGGHVGWVKDAFPESATVPWRGFIWNSPKAGLVSYRKEFEELLKFKGFAVLAVNAEALISEECKRAIGQFMVARKRIMVTADESTFMMEPGARRSKVMANIAAKTDHVAMTRILDGQPVGRKGPLDYYQQVGFLGHDILGYPNPVEFKAHYAELKTHGRAPFWGKVNQLKKAISKDNPSIDPKALEDAAIKRAKGAWTEVDGKKVRLNPGRDWWVTLVEDDNGLPIFKNVDELWERLEPVSYRATFAQCFPDSARPVFAKRYFPLSKEQRRVYDELDQELSTILKDGTEITAAHQLTRTLRLQQVASNYYPEQNKLSLHDDCMGCGCEACGGEGIISTTEPLRLIDPDNNPRADALREELKEGRPTIVWARFRQDIDTCMEVAAALGMNPVQYDGRISNEEKLENRELFQSGKAGAFVAQWSAAARAIPLYRADKHVCYSNGYSFFTRQQAEERAEHGSKKMATSIVDLVAQDTVDDQSIIPALRQGLDVSTYILRDARKSWL